MKRLLVVGATGFIGSYLLKRFSIGGWEVIGSYFTHPERGFFYMDITNASETLNVFRKISPNVVCLSAANPNVDYCEEHPSETEKINVEGTKNVALACREIGAKLVYFSSDYVFDGTSGPYGEEDIPNPISVYGRQKLASERIIMDILNDYIIARITVVYGWENRGKNFIERLSRFLEDRKEVKVSMDQIGSPTYVENLADMIFALVETKASGVFNVCGSDLMSRYEFACRAAQICGWDTSYIKPVSTAELRQRASRPLNAGMKTDKIRGIIQAKPMGAIEGLRRMKERRLNING